MKKRKNIKGFRLFNIITKVMIIIMLYYIGAKLTSLVIVGETRKLLILETKQYLVKQIKTVVCNEILPSDEYLTEDRIIRLTTIQKNRKSMTKQEREIDSYIGSLNMYKGNVEKTLSKLKDNIKKDINLDFNTNKDKNSVITYGDEKVLNNYKSREKELKDNLEVIKNIYATHNYSYMMNKFFMVDRNTSIDKKIFNAKDLLKINNSIKKDDSKPQILIYHTHSNEGYVDSRKGKKEDTVVGVGAYLKELLSERYGYNVIHNTKEYDVVKGKWNRNAYDTALPSIKDILSKNKSIEVVIDLHRDSGKEKSVTKIGGVNVAKVMFFNGVSRSKTANRAELENKYLKENIGFSLAMQMKSMSMYKDYSKRIYLKGYRYNMHVAKKTTLIEVGNNKNTVSEAKNAMVLYAKILNEVLKEKDND